MRPFETADHDVDGSPRSGAVGPTAHRHWRLWLWAALTIALLSIGAALVEDSTAVPATAWMRVYDPGDFSTAGELVEFLRELRMPIPPVISALEILSFQYTGSTDLVTKLLYRTSLVGGYVLALWLSYPSLARLLASFAGSVVFLRATTLIHPSNPQVYDPLFPFFVLCFLILARAAAALPSSRLRTQTAFCMAAGFFLAMAELDRPYVLAFLPFLLTGAYLLWRDRPRHPFVALLIPLGLFSGVWHVHLYLAHGQVLSTNYAGFNLRRAWPQAPLGPSIEETSTRPPDDRRWPDLNNEEQAKASRFLQRAVLAYWIANPGAAIRHGARRVLTFVGATRAAPERSQDLALCVYSVAAPASFVFLFANLLALGWHAAGAKRRCLLLLARPENQLLLTAGASLLVLSLGEANEEPRLVLCVLPFLAAYPIARPIEAAPRQCALRATPA